MLNGIVFSNSSSHLDDLAAFVTASPTSYHAAWNIASRLADALEAKVAKIAEYQTRAGKEYRRAA